MKKTIENIYGTQETNKSLKRPHSPSLINKGETLKALVQKLSQLRESHNRKRRKLNETREIEITYLRRNKDQLRNINDTNLNNDQINFLDIMWSNINKSIEEKKRVYDNAKESLNTKKKATERPLLNAIHKIIFEIPNIVFSIPPNMLPTLKFISNAPEFHPDPGNPDALYTRTIEFRRNRERWRNAVRRLQAISGDSSKSNAFPTGKDKMLQHGESARGVSNRPRVIREKRSLSKKVAPMRQIKLYHTIAFSSDKTQMNRALNDMKPSSIGSFGKSYWHTDPMFQWPGVGLRRYGIRNETNPPVQAIFTLTAPLEDYQKWIKTSNRLNRNATGTGTTLQLQPFIFRVDNIQKKNHNHTWDAPHFKIQWLRNV